MADPTVQADDFAVTVIRIDYAPHTPDPGRVFRSMAVLIEAFEQIDRDLARAVSATVEPQAYLERVEAGSVRAVLRTLLREVDDDALKNLDWKPLVGQYLVKGKQAVLSWLEGKDAVETRTEILGLRDELQRLAPASVDGLQLPASPVPIDRLLGDLRVLSDGVAQLQAADSAELESGGMTHPIETSFRISQDDIKRLLTQRSVESTSEQTLLVKRPDYLGRSKWEFRVADQTIEAKMLDEPWLEEFRRGRILLQPGHSLVAVLRAEAAMGFDGEVVATSYEVLRVISVIRTDIPAQRQLGDAV